MPSIDEGRYRLYNARNTAVSMTVHYASCKNGANVHLSKNGDPEKNASFADVWQLTYRADGTAQLINVYAGKSLDVAGGKVAPRTNVQIWTDNDSRAQAWDIVPSTTGKTATVGGKSYQTHYIQLHSDPEYVCDAQGYDGAAKRNVQLFTRDADESTTDQLWAFVPVRPMEDGAICELRPVANKGMAAGVSSGSRTDGARVVLGKANGKNEQKWYLAKASEGDGETPATWTLRAMHSGMNLNAQYNQKDPGKHDGQALTQKAWDGSDRQLWDVQRVGGDRVDGTACDVVSLRTCQTPTGEPYYVDSYNGLHSNTGGVVLKAPSSTTSQQWCLKPTTATDGFVPIVAKIRLCERVGSNAETFSARAGSGAIPTWVCTAGWSPSGPNHYEWRWRTRDKAAVSSTWQDWTEWTEWEVAGVTVKDNRAWLTEGVPAGVGDWALSDNATRLTELELQVRCVVCDAQGITHGPAEDQVLTLYGVPGVTLGDAGFDPAGIRVPYSSDWWAGTNTIRVDSVRDETTGTELLARPVTVCDLDSSGTILLPRDAMADAIPEDGHTIRVSGGVGYDEWGATKGDAGTLSATVKVAYTAGLDIRPEVSVGKGRTIKVEFAAQAGGTNRLWVNSGSEMWQVDGSIVGGKATYYVAVPFGKGVSLWADATSADGDMWGIAHLTVGSGSGPLAGYSPCHAWNWGDGQSFLLECRADSPMETRRTLKPSYETYSLGSRRRNTVKFGAAVASEFEAEGLLYEGLTESTVDDLIALQDARHVTYRAPSGEVAEVAITGIEYTRHGEFTVVSVDMIEETV